MPFRLRNVKLQSWLAFGGLLVMAVCVAWLQMLPMADRLPTAADQPRLGGPIGLVIIDAGHGGNDSGALREGVREKDLTLDVALRLERLLKANGVAT